MKYIVTGAAGHLGVNLVGKIMLKKDAIVKAVLLPGDFEVLPSVLQPVPCARGRLPLRIHRPSGLRFSPRSQKNAP